MKQRALIIGAGPAGLMAAEELARAGADVTVAEAMPSPARKLLMAGKSGLNLTKEQRQDDFLAAYGELAPQLRAALTDFGPDEVRAWADSLGQPLFTGSSGRVFPRAMKASPLLRAWLARLREGGVALRTNRRWVGLDEGFVLDTPEGPVTEMPDVAILATGGASWPRLGSDGAWAPMLASRGVEISPFRPANMGFDVAWSGHMADHFGTPVKDVALMAGECRSSGEFVISENGLEGGGIYAVSRAVREGAPLLLDLAPALDEREVARRLSRQRRGESLSNRLRKGLKFPVVKRALLMEFARPLPGPPELARLIKRLPVRQEGPRPMAEAISAAGGISFAALDDGLMLNAIPGVFCAGEMLDWEAPTGGYLLTACLATGRHAGRAAAEWLTTGKCTLNV